MELIAMREHVVADAGFKEDAHAKVSVPVPNNASNRSAKRSPRSILRLCVPTKASHQTCRGECRADNDCLLRARLLQAIQGDFERGTGADGALDEWIELAIVQRTPPFRTFHRTVAVVVAEPL
jgi:hypothetical protein